MRCCTHFTYSGTPAVQTASCVPACLLLYLDVYLASSAAQYTVLFTPWALFYLCGGGGLFPHCFPSDSLAHTCEGEASGRSMLRDGSRHTAVACGALHEHVALSPMCFSCLTRPDTGEVGRSEIMNDICAPFLTRTITWSWIQSVSGVICEKCRRWSEIIWRTT